MASPKQSANKGITCTCVNCSEISAIQSQDKELIRFLDKTALEFDDICGLEDVKDVLKEYIYLPLKFPKLFSGPNCKVSRTVLLFGAPGVGKTYLTRSLGSQCTLFRCYFNDFTDDVVSELFDTAIEHQPSCVVIEECENCDITMDSDMKYVTFINRQLSILLERGHNVHVVFITNRPERFPELLLETCEIFIYIPMPDFQARVEMFHSFIEDLDGFTCSGID